MDRLRDALMLAACRQAASTLVPSSYVAAQRAIEDRIASLKKQLAGRSLNASAERSSELLPLLSETEVKSLLSNTFEQAAHDAAAPPSATKAQKQEADNRLALLRSPELVDRCLRYLHSIGVLYSDPRLGTVVLEPLDWLPRVLSAFMTSNRQPLVPNQNGACLFSDIAVQAHEFQCSGAGEIGRLMGVLCGLEVCYPIPHGHMFPHPAGHCCPSADPQPCTTDLTAAETHLACGYLFPFLLGPARPIDRHTDWFLSYPLSAAPTLTVHAGRRFTVSLKANSGLALSATAAARDDDKSSAATPPVTRSLLLPPAFFPTLQHRVLGMFGLDSCRLLQSAITVSLSHSLSPSPTPSTAPSLSSHSPAPAASTAATTTAFSQCQVQYDTVRKRLDVVCRSGCSVAVSGEVRRQCLSLLHELLGSVCSLIEELLGRYPGLEVGCSALCTHCLPQLSQSSSSFPLHSAARIYSQPPVAEEKAGARSFPSRDQLVTSTDLVCRHAPQVSLSGDELLRGAVTVHAVRDVPEVRSLSATAHDPWSVIESQQRRLAELESAVLQIPSALRQSFPHLSLPSAAHSSTTVDAIVECYTKLAQNQFAHSTPNQVAELGRLFIQLQAAVQSLSPSDAAPAASQAASSHARPRPPALQPPLAPDPSSAAAAPPPPQTSVQCSVEPQSPIDRSVTLVALSTQIAATTRLATRQSLDDLKANTRHYDRFCAALCGSQEHLSVGPQQQQQPWRQLALALGFDEIDCKVFARDAVRSQSFPSEVVLHSWAEGSGTADMPRTVEQLLRVVAPISARACDVLRKFAVEHAKNHAASA